MALQKETHEFQVMLLAEKLGPLSARPLVPSAIQGIEAADHPEGMVTARAAAAAEEAAAAAAEEAEAAMEEAIAAEAAAADDEAAAAMEEAAAAAEEAAAA